jgi:core-2/I-Branching enzyme
MRISPEGEGLKKMTPIVCYYVQSHRDPEQIVRLVRTLRRGSPRGVIVVLHDFEKCDLDAAPLAELGAHLLRPSQPLVRSTFSGQSQPYLDVVDWLEREGVAYDWLVNLTAQDYPVKPVAMIESFLGAAACDGFICWWDALSPDGPWSRRKARARYWYRYRRLPPRAEPWLRALRVLTRVLPLHFYLDYGAAFGVRAWRTPFRDGFRCYGGWTWFSLRRRAVVYLRDFLAGHPEVLRHYLGTVAPEESLVQTVLVNSGRFHLVNDDLRYVDYSQARKGAPRTLTATDLPLLATGRYHFARKFDLGVDAGVLDRIDRELLGIG